MRFAFGANWQSYLATISDAHLESARKSLAAFLGVNHLVGASFLDVGCGSGIHSYAAFRLGANPVRSFDFDRRSVEAALSLKERKAADAADWIISQGDILDRAFVRSLGSYDLVYAWGVLHHSGDMWKAMHRTVSLLKPGGRLFLSIYNHSWKSPTWKRIKHLYCASPTAMQAALLFLFYQYDALKRWLLSPLSDPGRASQPGARGMTRLHDLRDWIGGYPYEFAHAEDVQRYIWSLGLGAQKTVPNTGTGCHEFLFQRPARRAPSSSPFFGVVLSGSTDRDIGPMVECLKEQTFQDFKCWIVHDESRGSNPIALPVVGQDSRFEMVRRDAFRPLETSVPWIAFADADDLWFPVRLARCYDEIQKSPASGALLSNGFWFKDRRVQRSFFEQTPGLEGFAAAGTMIIRREHLDQVTSLGARVQKVQELARLFERIGVGLVAERLAFRRQPSTLQLPSRRRLRDGPAADGFLRSCLDDPL